MPQPDDMAKAVAYLVGDEADWSTGRVIFSTGSEITTIEPPRLMEVVRSERVSNYSAVLSTLIPEVFVPAEAAQRTGGGSNSRFGPIFSGAAGAPPTASTRANCLIVSEDPAIATSLGDAVRAWGMTPVKIGGAGRLMVDSTSPDGFETVSRMFSDAVEANGAVDAIVVVGEVANSQSTTERDSWPQLIESHSNVVNDIMFHGAWLRAAGRYSNESSRSIRIVHLTAASTPAGRTTSQAISQMVRNANDIPFPTSFDAYSISLETSGADDVDPMCALTARLVCAEDTRTLRGSEFVAHRGWIGLRSHPAPGATISFGGPDIPSWVSSAFRLALDD